MPSPRDIDSVLRKWDYTPGEVNARQIKARNGRDVLQMRVDMGLLQMETELRPDGQRPHGAETYFDYLVGEVIREGEGFELSQEQCSEADREFIQFYHRRLCWLSLREYRRAAKDADHSLAFMDFVREHSPDEEWTLSHEQYRPFVLFHRVQAGALAILDDDGPEMAIAEINRGLEQFRDLFIRYNAEDQRATNWCNGCGKCGKASAAATRWGRPSTSNLPMRFGLRITNWPPSFATSCGTMRWLPLPPPAPARPAATRGPTSAASEPWLAGSHPEDSARLEIFSDRFRRQLATNASGWTVWANLAAAACSKKKFSAFGMPAAHSFSVVPATHADFVSGEKPNASHAT